MSKKGAINNVPVFESDESDPSWYKEQGEDLRLPFPVEFEFSFIDIRGQIVIVAPFKCARSYSHGRAAVCHYPMKLVNGVNVVEIIPNFPDRWKLIDSYGNVVTTDFYEYIAPFQDEKVTVAYSKNKSVLLKRDGTVAATYPGLQAESANAGRIVTRHNSASTPYGIIDYNGDPVTDQKFASIGKFDSGLAPAQSMAFPNSARECRYLSDYFGYIGKQGELVIADTFLLAHSFHDGYASVKTKTTWALIDTKGSTVFESKYDHLGQYDADTGLIPFRSQNQCGFVDLDGKVIVKPAFAGVKEFSQGLAPATSDGLRWGYIDKNGTFAIEPTFQMTFPFSDDRALVCRDIGGHGPMQPLDSKNPTHLVKEARALRDQFKYDEARALFDKIIEIAPGTLAAKQAEAFKRTDLPTAAPAPIVALYVKAVALSNEEKFSEAEPKLIECIELERNYEPAYGALASIYIRTQRFVMAEKVLLQILSRNPNYGRGLDFLALTYGLLHNSAAAAETEIKLKQVNPYFKMDQ